MERVDSASKHPNVTHRDRRQLVEDGRVKALNNVHTVEERGSSGYEIC